MTASNIIFNYDFSGWKTIIVSPNFNKNKINQYLAWSLRNVISRDMHTKYWLNPNSASVKICVDVYYKKAEQLFGKKNVKKLTFANTKEQVLADIKEHAEEYEKYLAENKQIDLEIDIIVKSVKS